MALFPMQRRIDDPMKKTHRILLIAAALALSVTLSVSALSQGVLSSVFDAGCALLFDTDNVSLKAHATFAYNGEEFKTFDGKYVQDGVNSLMDIMLTTPEEDGKESVSGYIVVANGRDCYSIDRLYNKFYTATSCAPSDSVMTSSRMRNSLMHLGSLFLDLAEGEMSSAITTTALESGVQHQISLKSGDAPDVVNALLTMLVQLGARQYFYIELPDPTAPQSVTILQQDIDALRAHVFQQLYGKPLPGDIWSLSNGVLSEISDYINENYYIPLKKQYSEGYVVLCGNGEAYHYATYDEAQIAMGNYRVYYENPESAYRAWYQNNYGMVLTEDDSLVLRFTGNGTLKSLYDSDMQTMTNYYQNIARAGETAGIYVHADGTYTPIDDLRTFLYHYGDTTARHILKNAYALTLDETDAAVTMDDKGRITAAKGTVRILVADANGTSRPLDIAFDASATAYGDSDVPAFDPAEYNVVTYNEYVNTVDSSTIGIPEHILDIETIEFLYDTFDTRLGEGNG